MSKLLNQGGFGCIFYPGMNCNGNVLTNKKYASKLQQDNFSSHNEYKVGSIIKKLPLYSYNFVPVLNMCNINVAEIDKKNIEDCKIVKSNKDKKFVVMKLNYIEKFDFYNYLIHKGNTKKQIIATIFDSYIFILNNVETLVNNNIVHFDLKMQNIIINMKTKTPLIIDFGLSIPIKELKIENYSKYFYTFRASYYIWPIDVHIINYLIHINNELSKDSLESIVNEYVINNSALNLFSNNFKEKYKQIAINSYEKYIGKMMFDIINDLIQYWYTWDNYSLSIMYLIILNHISSYGFISNKLMIAFSNLLLYNIHPNAGRRKKISETKKLFEELFLITESISNYEQLIDNFNIKLFVQNTIMESNKMKNIDMKPIDNK
jgi:hypothetical protein